jgi:hypothetical protein
MWSMKCNIVPAIDTASRLITKVLRKPMEAIGRRKTFDRFTTADSYTWNITHNTESTAV